MLVTTAFNRLVDLPGARVSEVEFAGSTVSVWVRLRSARLTCPLRSFTTRAGYDRRPVASSWRHLDLGRFRLQIRAELRRLDCPNHGVRTQAVPFARSGARFTRGLRGPGRLAGWRPAWTRPRCAGWCGSTGTASDGSSNG